MTESECRTGGVRQHQETAGATKKQASVSETRRSPQRICKTQLEKQVALSKKNEHVVQESGGQNPVFQKGLKNGDGKNGLLPYGVGPTGRHPDSPVNDRQQIKKRRKKAHALLYRKHDVEARKTSESFIESLDAVSG